MDMKTALVTATVLAGLAFALPASAVTIAAFGQNTGATNGFTLSPNGGDTASTLSMTSVPVTFTAFLGGGVTTGLMSLSAASASQAVSILGQDGQRFTGNFCITSGPGCTGTNFISGTFSDAAFGTNGGVDLTVNVSDPTETLALTSDVLPASDLGTPNAFALSLVTGSAPLAILGSGATATLGAQGGGDITYFTTGDVSATPAAAPEPASWALMGVGLLGLTMLRRKSA
jgi:PEP-CTERM motif-containing protein